VFFHFRNGALVVDSSGERKGRQKISKRGRPLLRSYLYKIALVMVAKNKKYSELYRYLLNRRENPLKRKQALK
jgi:transposase